MHEGAVIQFVDWYADAMSGRLGGGTAPPRSAMWPEGPAWPRL